jgi:flagellar biosynthesis protein FliP
LLRRSSYYIGILCVILIGIFIPEVAFAEDAADVAIDMADEMSRIPVSSTVRLLVILTALTFIPAMLLVTTPFTRFIIVFSMLRQALGLQQSPPNQVLVGMALFLSLTLMQPVLTNINTSALEPYLEGEIETVEAVEAASIPMRSFMLQNTRRDDLTVMMEIGQISAPESLDDIPFPVVVSSFVLSELKTAFVIGVKIYIPFLVIDVIVANILLGMGMMVLPPVIISLPFKLLLFILMDGWSLLIRSMASSVIVG